MARYVSVVAIVVLFCSHVHAQRRKTDEVKNLPSVVELRGLLGKNHLDKTFKPIRRTFEHHPYASYFESSHEFYHEWRDEGISMLFEDDVLAAVFLYNEKVDGYHRWVGELPEELELSDDVDGVERKLGKPDTVNGGIGYGAMTYFYHAKGIVVRFQTWDPSDRRANVGIVTLEPRKSDAHDKGKGSPPDPSSNKRTSK